MAKILITGTSKGIGHDASLSLARAGHHVLATMRNPGASDLGDVAARESLPLDIHALDVDNAESVNEVFAAAGDLDVLINNAGILSYNTVEDEDIEKFSAVMNTNFFGTLRCCKAAIPRMREKRSGCIINVSSVAGRMVVSPGAAYHSSKHALEGFTEALAQEVTSFGIRVHLVQPGIIDTPMATTELPATKADSLYPQGRRMQAIFKMAAAGDAPANLVSSKFKYLLENKVDSLRHPVGPDSLIFLGMRATLSDEGYIRLFGEPSDEKFIAMYREITGADLTSYF
jgi:NAD(P)-dependent dehydrogenase (short-subunit alcohol dehydrogenase family)